MRRLLVVFLLLPLVFPIHVNAQESQNHVVEVINNAFLPNILEVEPGDTVTFVWAETAAGHNIAQVDDGTSLGYNDGFYSGAPAIAPFSWELPSEYMKEAGILYFICEPHATAGMTGKIIVGDATEETDTPIFVIPVFLALLLFSASKRRLIN